MSQPNEPTQNYEIQSPTLESQVKSLLPSVAGYGGLLRSTNTIVPVIDLTSAAEGSTLPESLQQALAFGLQTAFDAYGGTTTLANIAGFYRIAGAIYCGTTSTSQEINFVFTDGATNKKIFAFSALGQLVLDFIIFLDSGESLTTTSPNNNFRFRGSVRQVATKDGTLVTPSGF